MDNFRSLKLTDNFYGAEALITSRQVDNEFELKNKDRIISNIIKTARRMEAIREILGNKPIAINSWYRNPKLNKLVKGSDTSDHMTGSAVDFTCAAFGSPLEICKELWKPKYGLPFKQLIYEHTWVHISFDFEIPYTAAKLQVLTLLSTGRYVTGITDKSGFKI